MLLLVCFIVIGFILLIKGADFLVDGASDLAIKFHIPSIIVGLTIVSIGTSLPELFISSLSAMNGLSDMAIGNIIGSNLNNLLMILGISTIIRPIKLKKETRLVEIPMCLFITIIFMIFCNTKNQITRIEAVILITMFVIFILYTIMMALKSKNVDEIDSRTNKISTLKSLVFIILGIIALKMGGSLTIDSATAIARRFNLSEKIIGLTILAIGTSLPELVTSVTASIKGENDIAIGNILGSNIFNILLIIGVTALISPLTYNVTYNIQMGILIFATILLLLFPKISPKNNMSQNEGIIYMLMYCVFMIVLVVK